MTGVKVRLDDAMGTSLIMLYGLARDARVERPVLGDTVAAAAFDRVDYDFARLKLDPKLVPLAVATRALHFDTWVTEFLARHERATVVQLGAGLDSRIWRVRPGPSVTWYDVDFPEVVDVRRKIFPEHDNYHLIGSSVTDPEWLRRIRTDLPTIVVAQGLTMYLDTEDGHAMFRRITEHFDLGVILLDTHNRYAIRRQHKLVNRLFGASHRWAIEDASDLERRNPSLHCTDAVSGLLHQLDVPGVPRVYKVMAPLAMAVPTLRKAGLYVRYEFGDRDRL